MNIQLFERCLMAYYGVMYKNRVQVEEIEKYLSQFSEKYLDILFEEVKKISLYRAELPMVEHFEQARKATEEKLYAIPIRAIGYQCPLCGDDNLLQDVCQTCGHEVGMIIDDKEKARWEKIKSLIYSQSQR